MSLQIQETLQNYIAEHHLDKLLKVIIIYF